ncbi:alpha/beta fold hydrolase [Nocardioides gilvus]|uniref:alpha/beta fold hydrolase n=1 Tax=Nocardioides gilvus TaxID=1735589 RepID=UPI000D749C0C|nr:alpha/beta hydrolase [Nocardioides gilvus]
MIERHYADLADGQVHYLRAGSGAPVILLHSSPMSSATMVEWIDALAGRFTVLAMDTPGYGQSDPLPGETGRERSIPEYAQRVLDFADALGIDRFIVAGTHTGSKIALETAVIAPDRVAQLVMDGLGLYTGPELEEQLERYTPPVEPDWYGGHMLKTWHMVRNMWTFWPWYRQEADRRLPEDLPSVDVIHQLTFDLLRARPDWGLSYRAAFRYDARAALGRLAVPAVLVAKHADPLHEHLDRLAVEAPTLTVHSVGNDEHVARIAQAFDDTTGLPDAGVAPRPVHRGGTSRRYVRTDFGEVHVRLDGSPEHPPLLVVHGSPGSADSFEGLILDLAGDHLVISPDTLGNGYSAPSGLDQPEIADFARALAAVLDELGLAGIPAYGSHTGACLALELSCQRPDLVRGLVADGLPAFSDEFVADLLENYFIDMTPSRGGEHLVRAWHTVRDAQLYWPWYGGDIETHRPTAPSDTAELHRLVMEFIKSGPSYKQSYSAAFRFRAPDRLAACEVPVVVCATPQDMLREGSEALSSGLVSFVALEPDAGRDAAWAVREMTSPVR